MPDQKPPATPPAKSVDDLLGDLDAFSRTLEMESAELKRLADEDKRKREDAQNAAQAAAAAAEQAKRAQQANATASMPPGPRRGGALDILKKQATATAPREDPAVVRARMLATLNQQMREADKYLAEFILAVKEQRPAASRPYPFMHLGALQNVVLGEGWIDSRPKRIEGVDHLAYITMRYRIYADPPAKQLLLKDDMPAFEQYLKAMEAPYEIRPVRKNDFGQVMQAEFLIKGGPSCDIAIQADYDAGEVQFDLRNVRQLGRQQCRVAAAAFGDLADELARYILGADDDFAKRLAPSK
jgi:hypothetical protein